MTGFISKYLVPFLGATAVFCALMIVGFGWEAIRNLGIVTWVLNGMGGAAVAGIFALVLAGVLKLASSRSNFAKAWLIFFAIMVFVLGLTYVVTVAPQMG